jgi:prevent-host-death family protein
VFVKVTITQFRQDLFQFVNRALDGEPVAFVHKGVVFRVVPEKRVSKLSRLTAEMAEAPEIDWEQTSKELLAEMEAEWEKDWADL